MMYFHGTDDFVCPYEAQGEWYDPPRRRPPPVGAAQPLRE